MEKNENQLQEQQAPLKNHDDAFVQVGKNGEPVIPKTTEEEDSPLRDGEQTTLDNR
jgi:hypothetical protein